MEDPLSEQQREQIDALAAQIGHEFDPERMYARALEAAMELTSAPAGSLCIVDEERGILEIPITRGFNRHFVSNLNLQIGQGLIGWAVKHAQSVNVPDTRKESRFIPGDIQALSELAAPIALNGRVIGAIDVAAPYLSAFSREDEAALQRLADRLAPSIEHARRYDAARQRAAALHSLFKIGNYISQTLNLEELLKSVVEHAADLMQARIAALSLLDETGEMLVTKAVKEKTNGEYSSKPPLAVKKSLIGEAILSKKPLSVKDVQKDPRYQFKDLAQKADLRGMLAVPLTIDDMPLGALSVYKTHRHIFKADEIALTKGLADQAAIAIRNGRLYQEMSMLNDQVRQAEKIGMMGQMAAEFAHELRNPLTILVMLLDIETPGEDVRQKIQEQVKRMSGIAQKYLDFAKPSGGEFSATNVKQVVRNVLNMVKHRATQQNVRVHEEFPRASVLVSADQNQLEQVFLNLFLNALDAMPIGGRLSVKAETRGNQARIAVSDTGGGVPEHVQTELFKPFNTSKPSGTGLGLSIVKRIVLDHQGDIRHENAAEGARFILSLPLLNEGGHHG